MQELPVGAGLKSARLVGVCLKRARQAARLQCFYRLCRSCPPMQWAAGVRDYIEGKYVAQMRTILARAARLSGNQPFCSFGFNAVPKSSSIAVI